ncbi:hypothetical protein [Streptomyces colonosanans]|uniref:SseB protein N-terminal domain-containing protein n=1 Tax=Streptomyces colonosanans TaxID=1428652 RepID=A0A1S2PDF4_9ACTN|nr:hypothetical protein [Streptomyces colonosanans]OIJ91637.1 hypothetical protein BIV24_15360 [Streptomyces colonosanans]
MIEEHFADYDEARTSAAIEASDHLDGVVERLTALVDPSFPRAFTLTFAGRERHDGQAPISFVVTATGLDDAARVLATLPDFHAWYQADAASSEDGADIVYVPEQSHAGIPSSGEFVDLRGAQNPAPLPPAGPTHPSRARPAAPITGTPPAPAPAARTSH